MQIISDPWVPSGPGFRIYNRTNAVDTSGRVCELIDEINRYWNIDNLKKILHEDGVTEVLKILLPLSVQDDLISWQYNKWRHFTVKSPYLICKKTSTPKLVQKRLITHFGTKVWNSQVPPRVTNFAWHAILNSLHVKTKLIKIYMCVDSTCMCCGETLEVVSFILCSYTFASKIWYLPPLPAVLSEPGS